MSTKSTSQTTTPEKRRCVACSEEIPIDASLCFHCDSDQERWKNFIRRISPSVGLITIAFAALAFLTEKSCVLIKNITWQDQIQVLSLRIPGSVNILNTGDGDVFVHSLRLDVPEIGHSAVFPLDRKLAVQSLEKIDVTTRKTLGNADFLVTTPEISKQVRKDVLTKALSETDKCFDIKIYAENDSGLAMVAEHTNHKLWTFEVKGTLSVRSFKKDKVFEQTTPLVGTILRSNACKQPQQ